MPSTTIVHHLLLGRPSARRRAVALCLVHGRRSARGRARCPVHEWPAQHCPLLAAQCGPMAGCCSARRRCPVILIMPAAAINYRLAAAAPHAADCELIYCEAYRQLSTRCLVNSYTQWLYSNSTCLRQCGIGTNSNIYTCAYPGSTWLPIQHWVPCDMPRAFSWTKFKFSTFSPFSKGLLQRPGAAFQALYIHYI